MNLIEAPDSSDSTSIAAPANASFENGKNRVSYIRFLISNAAAGSVIGKGGATVSEFQSQSGARIKLSRTYEYFPWTTDRVLTLIGTTSKILKAFGLILSKISGEAVDDLKPKASQVRLVVPNNICGAIIGKGGATIRGIIDGSHATIKLSSQEQTMRERLVTISGTFEQQLHAVVILVRIISKDANYVQHASDFLSYTGRNGRAMQHFQGPFVTTVTVSPISYGFSPYVSYGVNSNIHSNINNNIHSKGTMAPLVAVGAPPFQLFLPKVPSGSPGTFVTLAVPDEYVGIIVGRGGRTVSDIQQMSGGRIKISSRGDFVAGTTARKMTITGSANCVFVAQQLITQKIQESMYGSFDR